MALSACMGLHCMPWLSCVRYSLSQPEIIACRSSDGPPQDGPAGGTPEGDSAQAAPGEDRLGLGMERGLSGTETRNMQPRAKVMAVAEGLEEELFVAEAYRHDAEVSWLTTRGQMG